MPVFAGARSGTRAYQATFWAGVLALFALFLAGVVSSLWKSRELPSLRPLATMMTDGEPEVVLRELSMSTRFTANADMTKQLLQLANSAKDVEASILGTRHLIEIGAVWDAPTFNRLAALLLQRGGALGNALGSAPATTSLDDIREAREWSARAAGLEPDNAESHLYQGIACAQLDERERATLHLKEALRLNPGLSMARRALENLGEDAGGR